MVIVGGRGVVLVGGRGCGYSGWEGCVVLVVGGGWY